MTDWVVMWDCATFEEARDRFAELVMLAPPVSIHGSVDVVVGLPLPAAVDVALSGVRPTDSHRAKVFRLVDR